MFTPWDCAHGEAVAVRLECLPVVALSPDDDSVDTNAVTIFGTGTIHSFGRCAKRIIMRVAFEPNSDSPIWLANGPLLNLLGKKDRTVSDVSYATYLCQGDDMWVETSFTEAGQTAVSELEQRFAQRMDDLEETITAVELRLKRATGEAPPV